MTDPAAWAALGVSLISALPRAVAAVSRSRTAARESDITRFEALYDKQDRLIARLESRCDELEARLSGVRSRKP